MSMVTFLADQVYYGIEVDESKIVCNYGPVDKSLAWMEDDIKSWRTNISVVTVTEEYMLSKFMQTHELSNTMYNPSHPPSPMGNFKKAQTVWDALSMMLVSQPSGGQSHISDSAQEKCNEFLCKVGLEIITVTRLQATSTVKVKMKLTTIC